MSRMYLVGQRKAAPNGEVDLSDYVALWLPGEYHKTGSLPAHPSIGCCPTGIALEHKHFLLVADCASSENFRD